MWGGDDFYGLPPGAHPLSARPLGSCGPPSCLLHVSPSGGGFWDPARAVVPLFKVAKRGPRAWVAPLSVSPAFSFHNLRPRADVHRKVFFRHILHCDCPWRGMLGELWRGHNAKPLSTRTRLVCLRRAPRESHVRYSSKTVHHSSFR